MLEKNVFPLTVRLTGLKLRASKFTLSLAAFLPPFLVFLAVRTTSGTAMKFFLFFFPYVFLVAAQDMVGTEVAGGALENVLFLQGGFRRYLWQKNFALAAAAATYAASLFFLVALWGVACGKFDPLSVP